MVLVVYAHPNPESFNSAIRKTVEEYLKERGLAFEVRDLYTMGFNPILSTQDFLAFERGEVPEDIKREQELVRQANTLVFIFPMWWYSFPAILKGYIDRVFSHGFAYKTERC